MVQTKLNNICRNLKFALALLACSFAHSASPQMTATMLWPIRVPAIESKNKDFLDQSFEASVSTFILKQELLTIELPGKEQGNDFFNRLLSKSGIDLSLKTSCKSILNEKVKPSSPSSKIVFPQIEIKGVALNSPPCAKKHLFKGETYPNFIPFGQFWLKDPLGAFPYYREQLTTNHIFHAGEWNVEDSFLGAFLSSSITRLEKTLDQQLLVCATPDTKNIPNTTKIDRMIEQPAALKPNFQINKSINLNASLNLTDLPYFTSLSDIENKKVLSKNSYFSALTKVSLPDSIEGLCVWKENLASEYLKIVEYRKIKAIFHSTFQEPSFSSESTQILNLLLTRVEKVQQTIDERILAKQFPLGSENTYKLDEIDAVNSLIAFNTPLFFNLSQMNACNIIKLNSGIEKAPSHGSIEPIICPLSYEATPNEYILAVDSYSSNPSRYFPYDKEQNEKYDLTATTSTNPIHCSFTFAGVYFDDFYAPISLLCKNTSVKTAQLSIQTLPVSSRPTHQKGLGWNEAQNILLSINDCAYTGKVVNDISLTMTDNLYVASLFPSTFGQDRSPLYDDEFIYPDTVNRLLIKVSPLRLTKGSFSYLREPYSEKNYFCHAEKFEHVDCLFDLKSISSQTILFSPKKSENIEAMLVHDNNVRPHHECDDHVYTQSYCEYDIDKVTLTSKISTLTTKYSPISFYWVPNDEQGHFVCHLELSPELLEIDLSTSDLQSSTLSLLKFSQTNNLNDIKCVASSISFPEAFSISEINFIDFDEIYKSTCIPPKILATNYSDFSRSFYYDQKDALLSYQTNIDASIPGTYFLLPRIELTQTPFLPLSGGDPNLISTTPFSQRASFIELAREKNQLSRFTHLGLTTIPSLTYLNTDSLGDEFDVLVRTTPKKTGDGFLFSILLAPIDKNDVDPAPNHIYYLLDRSSTIEEHRFHTFKKAISQSLAYLDEGTSYNIAMFDFDVEWLSPKDLAVNKNSLKFMRKHLSETKQRGKTNIAAFAHIIETLKSRARETGEPHTLILLSDGRFMKNLRLQRQMISSLINGIPDTFSLFAASTSDDNNLGMLDLLTGLCKGDAVHARTHSSFSRKLAALTKRVHRPIGFSTKVVKINQDDSTELFTNNFQSKQLYANKAFKIYGQTQSKKEIKLLIQAYNGDRFINIPKTISFKDAHHSPSRLEQDYVRETSLDDFMEFIETGDGSALIRANERFSAQNIPLLTR